MRIAPLARLIFALLVMSLFGGVGMYAFLGVRSVPEAVNWLGGHDVLTDIIFVCVVTTAALMLVPRFFALIRPRVTEPRPKTKSAPPLDLTSSR